MKRKLDGDEASAQVDTGGIASLPPNLAGKQNAPATSIRPSRLAPSVPMHMKTRGSQKALSIMSGSASGDSRRSSLSRSVNGVGQSGDDIDQPAKRQRTSRESSIRRSSQSSNSSDGKASVSQTPKLATFSTSTESISSAKRKHSDVEDDGRNQHPVDVANAAPAQPDVTPNAPFLHAPLRKRLGRPPKKQKINPAISGGGAAPLLPAKRPPGRPPRLGRLPLNRQAVGGMVHRIPGRRRKPNPDAELDADLGRLAELRRNYRMLTKIVKPAIAELAERAIAGIENDHEAHKKSPQYQLVQDELDARLNQRIALVEREYKLKVAYEKKKMAIEEECIRVNFERKIRELQEKYIIDSKHEVIEDIRAIDTMEDNEATEDESEPEDELATPRSLLRDTSRSIFPIETERKWKALEARGRVAKLLETYAPGLVEDMKRHELSSYQYEDRARVELENIRKLASATTVVNAAAGATIAIDALADLSTKLLEAEDPTLDQEKPVKPIFNGVFPAAKPQLSGDYSMMPVQPLEIATHGKEMSPSNATARAAAKHRARPLDPLSISPIVGRLEYGSFGSFENVRSSADPVKVPAIPKDVPKVGRHEGEFFGREMRVEQGQNAEGLSSTVMSTSQQGIIVGRHSNPVTSPLRTSMSVNSEGSSPATNTPIQPAMGSLDGFYEDSTLTNYQRAVQPRRQSGLVPLHNSPRALNIDSIVGSPTRGMVGQGKQTASALSPVARPTGKAQSVPASAIPQISPYISPYGHMNEQTRGHSAATVQVLPVVQQLARPNLAQATGSAHVLPNQTQQLQQVPLARRRELRPAPNPIIPAPIFSRYPQENYYSNPVYGYSETETSPIGRVPEGFYGYPAPFDPTGGQPYYQNGPYLHPTLQPLQYPYVMFNPSAAQPVSPSQSVQHQQAQHQPAQHQQAQHQQMQHQQVQHQQVQHQQVQHQQVQHQQVQHQQVQRQQVPHQQAPAHLQPAFAVHPRIAPNHAGHSAGPPSVPPPPPQPPQRPLTFQYYQPPGGNQPGPAQNEQPRR
ncbi:MAG: hypothetical protein M1840_006276 [Geoglossum simile]|nr:MAG: hypothetical protein M1840_006276 [Geoglossum simile]